MPETKALSVSELTGMVKNLIEETLPSVVVEGELSNWRPASSGHVYFTMKDSGASLQAVMFKGRSAKLAFRPADGLLVRAHGSMGVYASRGQYQLVVDSMERAGSGEILAMLEERKRALAAEGLFDLDRKRPIPVFPRRVAVITSPTGAALRDILSVLGRRNAGIRVTILPAAVQGDEAPAALARQIRVANTFGLGDVIIVGRGGGSLEDLLAFSDELVVRAVAASGIPVISAVGHEIDWSLCDFAADLRAATPSAAAELVSESADSTVDRVMSATDSMVLGLRAKLERTRLLVESFSADNLEMRLDRILQPTRQRFDYAIEGITRGVREACVEARHTLHASSGVLRAADPMAILARGFAVVRRFGAAGSARAVRASSELEPGARISILFSKGDADANVVEVRK
jgi:exodeoxyribonuclease VII large subunit